MKRFTTGLSAIPAVGMLLFLGVSSEAWAQVNYVITATLQLQSGSDPLGLNGVTVHAKTTISQTASPTSSNSNGTSSTNSYSGVTVTLAGFSCDTASPPVVTLTDNVGAPDTLSISNCSLLGVATVSATATIPAGYMITAVPAAIPQVNLVSGTITAQQSTTPPSTTVFNLTNATIVATGTPPPTVTASPTSFSPSVAAGTTTASTQAITLTPSVPTAVVSFSTSATATGGGSWLTVSPAAANTSSTITISADPSGLAAGTYSGTVSLSYGNSGVSATQIPVTLTVTGSTSVSLTAAPTSMTFAFTPGGTPPGSQTLTISGGTAVSVSAAVTSGGSWLSISPASGSTPATFTVSVNTSGLTSGTQNGSIQITSSGASNSPLSIPVTLTVSSTTLTVPSTPLTFNYTVGGSTPAAQSVSVTGTSGISFTTSTGGTAWLAATSSGTVPSSISVSINAAGLSGLSAGAYNGSVTVTSSGAAGSPATIPVTLNVTAPSLTVTPSKLTFNYQIGSSSQPASQTITISNSSNASFTATAATTLGGSWLSVTPGSGSASGTLTVSVNTTGLKANALNGTVTIAGPGITSQVVNVTLESVEPAISGIVSAASYSNNAFSPGMIVSIFGNLLGPQTGSVFGVNSTGTINTTLGGTTVTVEGSPAVPLFAQNGQVNVILPYSLNTDGEAYVEVKYNNTTSVQFNIPLAPASVQIFTADASGSGPGSIVNQDGSVNSSANPAAKGTVVSVFGTGGGALTPGVSAGAIAGTTLAWVTLPYSATVNGENAKVSYAGSAPGLVYGVYQFNVQLPSDVASGAQNIVLQVGNSTSQAGVTVFVK